jgi:glycosyltransferase involved in cell wall biosynthesis
MASGVPVVTTNTSSIPEVVGEAALMVSPHNVPQLAQTMGRVLNDDALWQELSSLGRIQVRRFNWYRVARNTLAVYYEVYNSASNKSDVSKAGRKFLPFELWRQLKAFETSHIG